MIRIRKRRWESRESDVTSEDAFLNRRALVKAALGAGALGGLCASAGRKANAALFGLFGNDKTPALIDYPPFVPMPARAPSFAGAGRAVTDEAINAAYNNFYEFGSEKSIAAKAQSLKVAGWRLRIGGMVEKPFEIGIGDLIKGAPMEERIVRHRCVEAWAMTVPWIGFPLSHLMALAKPLSGARYVRFETFLNPEVASGQSAHWYPWPYVEGLTMEEAANELAFLVVGAYGKILHKQFGAPIRLHVPWKYGFKSIKSIVGVSFVDKRPVSFWEESQGREYGFWANVNPQVAHPRWSQATERLLGTNERVKTRLFNGYGEQVAHLYGEALRKSEADRLWR